MLWLLSFFPGLLVHLALLVGVAALLVSYLLGSIPFIKLYSMPIRLVGYALLCGSLYFEGGLSYKKDMDLKTAHVQTKIAVAEVKSANANTAIEAKVDNEKKIIHEKGATITQYIDRWHDKIDESCTLSPEAIKAHNLAASLNADTVVDLPPAVGIPK